MPDRSSESVSELRVRYAETDQMGVVYHANYLVWCEIGRTDFLRRRGPSYAEMERDGILLAVADASLRFHRSAVYDDLIRVRTSLASVRSRAIDFDYVIGRVNDHGTEDRLVSARTTLIAIDRASRPRALPRELLSLLRPFVSTAAGETSV
jgi:acyl-CoA thioester hydrolase